ncbi:MAG: DUF262 domain-containing protein [Armatimonadetes bacterium]|nr:DUF262 domain-containing protein [Armatimonadota bacterium]
MKASETKLQPVLEGTKQFVVPMFQRTYSWDTKEWGALWSDLQDLCDDERGRGHFMGSIVTMPTASVPEGVSKYLLVDGQQRLTTIFILLAVVRDRAKALPGKLAKEIENLLLTNQFQDGLDRYKLLPTQGDREAFMRVMEGNRGEADARVFRAYRYFDKCLRGKDAPDLEALKNVLVMSLLLVSIVLDRDDNPHLIFESLNAKGQPLSQADLIRNYFFMKVHVDKQESLYTGLWKPMQDELGPDLTEFIRHYLMKDGGPVRQGDVYLALKARGDQLAPPEVLRYLDEITVYSRYYGKLLQPDREPDARVRERIARLNRIEVTSAYPFMLNAYHEYATGRISPEEFADILETVENFIIRRFVCGVPTNQLNKIFPTLYRQAVAGLTLADGVKEVLRTRSYPQDSLFRERFVSTQLYGSGERLGRLRIILERLEQSFDHAEPVDLNGLTVEHIMPQTLTEWWMGHLGEAWELIHDLWLHTIGNMTLSGYNAEMSNADYPAKANMLARSHLELNRWFANVVHWDEGAIRDRGEHLATLALGIWPYFGKEHTPGSGGDSDVTGTDPTAVIIVGQRMLVQSWRDVAQYTLESLSDLDPDTFQEMAERFPRLIGRDPGRFRTNRQLSNGFYMETNLSAPAIKRFCIQVTQLAGLSPDDWQVELA